MIKTGSKFLFGLAAFAFVAAVVWAASTADHEVGMDALTGPLTMGYKGYVGEHVGYTVLVGVFAVSLFLGIFLSALRDSDPDAAAQVVGLDAVPEVEAPATVNYWPVVAAFSLAAVALGLAIGPTIFVIGMIGLAISTVEWAVRAWSDRATGDPEVNRTIRNRFMYPVEVPGLAVLAIGGLVLAVSRILLALPKGGSYAVFTLVPIAVLAIGALIVLRPNVSSNLVAVILLVGAVAILGGGIAAAIAGEREHSGGHEDESHDSEEGMAPMPHPSLTTIRVSGR